MSAEEAGKARSSRRMRLVQSFAGLGGILNTAATLVRNGRPFSDIGEEIKQVARIGETELNRLAYNGVPLEHALLVLVGDKGEIEKQLEGLDLPAPTEFTVNGDPVQR